MPALLTGEGYSSPTEIIPKYGDRPLPVTEFETLAEQGDAEAAYHAGDMYRWGTNGTPISAEKAAYWLERAARMGNVDAMVILSDMAKQRGDGESEERWLRAAAKKRDAIAFQKLAAIVRSRGEETLARQYEERAAEAGSYTAVVTVATRRLMEQHLSPGEASQQLARLWNHADTIPRARITWGLLLESGRYLHQDRVEAYRCYRSVAELKDNTYAENGAREVARLRRELSPEELAQAESRPGMMSYNEGVERIRAVSTRLQESRNPN